MLFVMIETFLCFSCLLELGEGALAQWVVALITLTFFEHEYVGISVLVCFYFLFQQLHESCVWKKKVSRNANVPPRL